jgi:hypothetical protein
MVLRGAFDARPPACIPNNDKPGVQLAMQMTVHVHFRLQNALECIFFLLQLIHFLPSLYDSLGPPENADTTASAHRYMVPTRHGLGHRQARTSRSGPPRQVPQVLQLDHAVLVHILLLDFIGFAVQVLCGEELF